MPPAARVTDMTSHGPPLNPGPGSPDVMIGFMPAWRALPSGVGGALDAISEAMNSFMTKPSLNPGSATSDLVQISQKLAEGGAKAAADGAPAAAGTAASMVGTLNATNATLTATWTAASAVPGGQPAADVAYTQGIKAAAAAAASATVAAMASLADMHICPIPCPIPPHGPGFVTKGSSTVMINNLPPARQNDKVAEACGGSDPIALGCMTVDIGDKKGSGGGGGGGGAADAADTESPAQQQGPPPKTTDSKALQAALVEAAACGVALVSDPPVDETAEDRQSTFAVRVVDDETGEPVAGVSLRIKLPDGTEETHTTDHDGMIEIDDIDPGACDILEMIDAEAYEVVSQE